MVEQSLPYAAPPGKKNKRYTIADPYLRFWLRFIGPNIEEIDRGRSDLAVARIERDWGDVPWQGDRATRAALGGAPADRSRSCEQARRSSIRRELLDPQQPDRGGPRGRRRGDSQARRIHRIDQVGERDRRLEVGTRGSWPSSARTCPEPAPQSSWASRRSGFADDLDLDVVLDPGALIDAWR